MRNLFVGAVVVSLILGRPAFAECKLDATDFGSLALSKSRIQSQAQVDALDALHKKRLCNTRAVWRRFHSDGNRFLGTPPHYSPMYLSPDELTVWDDAFDDWVEVHVNRALSTP